MREIDLKNYEEVKTRIPKFYKKYPDGRIITEIINASNDYSSIIIQAYLYKDSLDQEKDLPLTTGIAHEVKDLGYVNKTAHIENCETSAIGRALANLGLHGDNRPSREEMEKVQRMSKSEEERKKNREKTIEENTKIANSPYYKNTEKHINDAKTLKDIQKVRWFLDTNKQVLGERAYAELYERANIKATKLK